MISIIRVAILLCLIGKMMNIVVKNIAFKSSIVMEK